MKVFRVEIKGDAGLMQHRYRGKTESEAKVIKRGAAQDHADEWKSSLYWADDVGIYIPANCIEAALIKASTDFQIPGKRKKSYKELFRSALFVRPDRVALGLNGSPERLLETAKIILDERPEVVNRARILRVRPVIPTWQVKFDIEIIHDQVPLEIVREALIYAGKFMGLLERRPRFGRFSLISFEERT